MVAAALLLAPAVVHAAPALPTGATVAAGKASISAPSNNYLTITQSSKDSIINWNSFSIGQGGTVQINNGAGATLNRVTGGSVSSIDGLLSATGSVYLINPNGVIIGKTGVVNTGGTFVASTLDVSNANFLAGGSLTFSGASTASVVNLGKVGSLGGDVALIASTVENDGTITAPDGTVGLIAGQQVTLKDADNDGNGLFSVQLGGASTSVTNTGLIEAANAELRAEQGNVYALAGNIAGVIRATGVDASDGKIWLVADGGTTTVAGTLDAQGANGSAGQIETSGQTVLVDTAAIDAHGGQWLLDPQNIEITAAAANTISSSLANNNVTEQTTSTTASETGTGAATTVSSGAGDITLDAGASISWGSSHALTLNAYNNLNIDGSITVSGAGTLNLTAGQSVAVNGPIAINGGGKVALNAGADTTTVSGTSLLQLYFAPGGDITFASGQTGQTLAINGTAYTLEYSSSALIAAMNANSNGVFALAQSGPGGSFTGTPVSSFGGTLEGLGNTISNLTINVGDGDAGLVGTLNGQVRDIGLVGGGVTDGTQLSYGVGELAGLSNGVVAGSFATGAVNASGGRTGGLVGVNRGVIVDSYTTGAVVGADAGGLVGDNQLGSITQSYATGAVSGRYDNGGLVGDNDASIIRSYAAGAVSGNGSTDGGLVGDNSGSISQSFATGAVVDNGDDAAAGGLVGLNEDSSIFQAYATGAVTAKNEDATVGGLVGESFGGSISQAYATGQVTANPENEDFFGTFSDGGGGAGPLIGQSGGTTVTTAYYNWQTTVNNSQAQGSQNDGANGVTTATLQSGGLAALGFSTSAWSGASGGLYPYLTSFFPNGVQAITGVTSAGSQVGVYAGGALLTGATTSTGANGAYYEIVAAGTLPTSGVLAGATVASSGASVSGLTYSNNLSFSAGILTLPSLTSGQVSETTGAATFSALQTNLASTFGSANLTALNTALASASLSIISNSGTGFTLDQPVTSSGSLGLQTTAGSLTIADAVSTGAGGSLTLNSSSALVIDAPITVSGAAAVNLTYNTAGPTSLSFAEGSSINYGAVNSGGTLKINGQAYTLLYKLADGTDVGPDSGGDDIAGIDHMGESGHYALATSLNGAGTTFTNALAGFGNAFTGTFEGLGNTITGLKISSSHPYVGLFDDLNPGAVIRDIGLIGGSVSGGTWTGALVAFDDGGTITAVYNTGSVSGSGRVGGLVGELFDGTLTQSYATGSVQGGGSTGGLVGEVYGGTLTQSYATGAVTGGSNGGLAGNVMDATISNSYATGYVAGDALIGSGSGISASNLYYNSDTTGASSSYGTGLTTSQLKGSLPSGFGAAWATGPGLYPYLTNFFPGGVQAITATTNGGAAGSQVGVYIGGVLLGGATASTGANGAYYEVVAAGTLPTSGLQAGVTVARNGSNVSGLAYADNLSLSGGVLTLPSLTSGQVSETTGAATYSALQTNLASTFGAANLAALNATLAAAPVSITATGAGFTLDQAVTATGGLTVTGSSITLDGASITSSGAVSLDGAVTLADANTITASTTTFAGTVDGAQALTLVGGAQFDDAVGAITTLTSLSVSGASALDGGPVNTTGAQTYSSAATLGADTTLTASNTTFGSTLDGAHALTITGNATLDGAVGASAALSSLSISGASTLDGGRVTTTGTQTYSGAATLGANTTLTASTVNFGSTLDGAYGLTITGKAAFNGAVGGLTELSSLSVSGTSIFDGGAVSTTGAQTYTGAATQDENTTLTAGGLITLGSTLNGKYALSLTGSALQFNGFVGSSQLPTSVTAVATDGNVTLGSSGRIDSAGAILIAANGDFINQDTAAGASALKPGSAGYVVYSQDPTNPTTVLPADTRGGLTGKDYFNDAYDFSTGAFASAVPTGNHFVYGYAATLTYTANTASSVYGSAISPLSGTMSGFVNGDTATTGTASYATTATSSSHVADGPFAITGSGLSSVYNYKFVQAAGNATAYSITPADLTITADNQSKVYGAALPTLTVSYSPFANGDTAASLTTQPNVTTTATAASHVAGSPYAINASGAVDSDYTISYAAGGLTVTPESITITAAANSKTYDSTTSAAATPTVTSGTLYDSATLSETYGSKDVGSNLTLTPTATIANASDYSVTLASANTGTITAEAVTITAAYNDKLYDGTTAASATPTLTSGTLYDNATLQEAYSAKDAGSNLTLTPTATITNAGDYSVTLVSANTGFIDPEPITITATYNDKSYDGTRAASATPTLTSGTLYDNAILQETYSAKDVGSNLTLTPAATITNANDYSVTLVSANSGFIEPALVTITATANSKVYDSTTSASATPTVTSGTLYDSATLTETYGSKDVGTGLTLTPTASISNAGDYSVTLASANTGTIAAEPITITAVANSKTYNDSTAASATPTVTSGTLYDSATLAETYGSKDVGAGLTLTPTATITNAGDYSVTLAPANTGTISAEAITITAAANSKTYDSTTSASAAPTVTSGTLYDNATLAEAYGSKDAGTGLTLTPTAAITNASDYAVTLAPANTGTITAEAITITAAANSKTYDSTISASATPTVTSGTLYDSATLAETYGSKDVGTGLTLTPTATITNAADYSVTLASANTGTITAEAITITAAANSKTYNDSDSASAAPTVTSGTLYDGATLAEAYATKDAGAGLTLIPTAIISNASDYSVTLASANTGTITAEAITITAAANSKTYDSTTGAAATPTVTSGMLYDGATLGETYASKDAGTNLTLIPTATITNAGDYSVTLASANTGTISAEAITITAAANAKTYDSTTSASATPTVTTGTLYDSATLAEAYATKDAGAGLTLTPTATITNANDYAVTLASANTGVISPEAITITAASNSKTYDSTTSASATPTVTSGTLYDAGSSALAETYTTGNAGTGLTLVPTASIPDATNYTVTLASANTGSITPEAITITAAANSKTYDSTTSASAAPTVTSGTLYDASGSTLSESYTTANAGAGLTLAPTASIPDASNYTVTLASANTGTITPEAITITAAANTKTYDGGTAAAATPTVTSGVLYDNASLSETYAGRDAGTGLTLTPTATITGASNYALTLVSTANGEIDPKAITASLTGVVDKTYDGTASATLGAGDIQLSGIVAGDTVTASATSAAYASANVGTGVSVTASGVGLGGAQARDYTLVSTTYSANIGEIDPRAITITANDVDKFVGQPDPALTYQLTSGSFVGADTASGALTRAAGQTPGDYAIQQGTLAVSGNYALTFVGGRFVIDPTGGAGSLAGETPDQSGFNSASVSFTLASGPRYTPSINPQAIGSTDVQCHIDRNCINVPYPANLDVGPDIRFVPGL